MLKYFLSSLALVLGLYAIGYFPSEAWDPPRGSLGLLCGLSLAFALMTGSFVVLRWALFRSQRIFMTVFGVGFIARLVIFISVFFAYVKFVDKAVVTFAISFGVCYLALSAVEYLCLRGYVSARKE